MHRRHFKIGDATCVTTTALLVTGEATPAVVGSVALVNVILMFVEGVLTRLLRQQQLTRGRPENPNSKQRMIIMKDGRRTSPFPEAVMLYLMPPLSLLTFLSEIFDRSASPTLWVTSMHLEWIEPARRGEQ